jgi:mannitol-specific phosphotransferase system IIBC component
MANSIIASEVKTIILACEAGMGSSLMSVNALKKKLKAAKVNTVQVVHSSVREVPKGAQVIMVHKGLAKTVRSIAPNAVVVSFSQFLNDPVFDKVVRAFVEGKEIIASEG